MATCITWEQQFTQPLVDYVKRTDQEIEEAKQQSREPNVSEFDRAVAEWVKSAEHEAPAPTNDHILATPLFEVSSIEVWPLNNFEEVSSLFEIYGHVKLTNNFGKEFLLFNRAEDKPIVMLANNPATLHKSKLGSARWLPQNFWLELFFVDKIRSISLFKEEFLLDFTRNLIYDKERVAQLHTPFGHVLVRYTVFRCALLAFVSLTVFKKANGSLTDVKGGSDVVVSGIVSTRTILNGGRTEFSRVLFDEESLPMAVNNPARLPPLAVPVSSSFKIYANLMVNDECIFSGDDGLEFEPTDVSVVPFWKEIMGEEWCIEVSVYWLHAYQYFGADETRKVVNSDDSESEVAPSEENEEESPKSEENEEESPKSEENEEESPKSEENAEESPQSEENAEESPKSEENEEESSKSEKESSKSKESEMESSENEESTKGEDVSGRERNSIEERKILRHRQLLEVFSISVCSLDDNVRALGLYGTIVYKNLRWNHVVYKSDREDSDIVHPHKPLLRLNLPPCREIKWGDFEMDFDLKDDKGLEISKGRLSWNHRVNWCNKRLCSVVPGEQGFACVHYAVFSDALAAKVRLILHTPLSPFCDVYGKVNARYSAQKYSNHYERKYYQSRLFIGGESVDLDLKSNASTSNQCGMAIVLPLLKNEVAVSSDTPLIIKANLRVAAADYEETLRGEATFDPTTFNVFSSKMISGTSSEDSVIQLEVQVQWADS